MRQHTPHRAGKALTHIRRAARLMAHLEDLQSLGKLTAHDVQILQEALFLLITQIQRDASHHQKRIPVSMPGFVPPKTYLFQPRNDAPNRMVVCTTEYPVRRLQHIPIFAYGFGFTGLSALDTALAILADHFGEILSLRVFAAGKAQYCRVYRAFANDVLSSPSSRESVETKHIVAFLQRQDRKSHEPGSPCFADAATESAQESRETPTHEHHRRAEQITDRVLLQHAVDTISAMVLNLADAEDDRNPESGEIFSDVVQGALFLDEAIGAGIIPARYTTDGIANLIEEVKKQITEATDDLSPQ